MALFSYETAIGSVYQKQITVYGSEQDEKLRPFPNVKYQGIKPTMELIFGGNGGYARSLAGYLRDRPTTGLIEVHNRVQIFNILARQFPNAPLVMHFHNDPLTIKGSMTPKERWNLLGRADAVYCCSDYIRRF